MSGFERDVRDLLRSVGAILIRTSGGHEIWQLPNGCGIYPIKNAGRKSNEQIWKLSLAGLRRALRRGKVLR